MLDELPSLEFAATAVAVVLVLRALVLRRKVGVVAGQARVESARARDLIGVAILAVAVLYAVRVERASTWFLVAIAIAIVAQLLGFYWRAAARPAAPRLAEGNGAPAPELDFEEDEDLTICPSCGHGELIEIDDTSPLLAGLSALTPVLAAVCPSCGALSGHVEDPGKIPLGTAHGTSLRQSPGGGEREALEEPAEHDG